MKKRHPSLGMESVCDLFGVSRQAHHQHRSHEGRQALEAEIVLQEVRAIRVRQPKVGTRKLLEHLKERLLLHGIKLGRDALFELLRERKMLVRSRKRKAVTTDSNHPYHKYPNLTIDFIPLKANELWVVDITYVETAEGFTYLSLVTDAYSRKLVGHCTFDTLEATGCLRALRSALGQLPPGHRLKHHSDRGSQYCSHAYTDLLKEHNIQISMTQNGDPWENAIAERVNGTIKNELLPDKIATKQQAKTLVQAAVETYNQTRLHASVDMLTPEQAHQRQGEIPNRWKPKPSPSTRADTAKNGQSSGDIGKRQGQVL